MLDFYEELVDDFVGSIKRNPAGSLAATMVGVKLYGAALVAAAPVALPAVGLGALVYGCCKLRK